MNPFMKKHGKNATGTPSGWGREVFRYALRVLCSMDGFSSTFPEPASPGTSQGRSTGIGIAKTDLALPVRFHDTPGAIRLKSGGDSRYLRVVYSG